MPTQMRLKSEKKALEARIYNGQRIMLALAAKINAGDATEKEKFKYETLGETMTALLKEHTRVEGLIRYG